MLIFKLMLLSQMSTYAFLLENVLVPVSLTFPPWKAMSALIGQLSQAWAFTAHLGCHFLWKKIQIKWISNDTHFILTN